METATRSLALIALSFLLTGSLAASENNTWPAWRGHDQSGVAVSTEALPTDWSKENILWKTPIEGNGHSSPVVWADRIFLTTAIEGDEIPGAEPPEHTFGGQPFKHPQAMAGNLHHTFKVIAIDRSSGEVVWSKVAYEGRVYDDRHKDSSYASPTTVTDGERVIAYFGSEGVYSYKWDGTLEWKRDIGDIKSVGLGVASSPVLHGSLLFLQADEDSGEQSFMVALDKRTGEEVWKVSRDVQLSWTTPLIVEHSTGTVLVTVGNEWVIAYDPAGGEEVWRVPGLANNAIHSPMVSGDLLIATSGYPEKKAFAVRLGGKGTLGNDSVAWTYEKGLAYIPSNVLYDGILYVTNDGGVLTALDPATGEVIYGGGRSDIRGRYAASLVAGGGLILQVNMDGDAAFIKAGDEHEVVATTSIDEPVWATPAIVDNMIYLRSRENLYAIGNKAAAE